MTALMGNPGVEVPASMLTCAGCHGSDGRGRPEGGIDPTDITWQSLTRSSAPAGAGGRSRPPYTEASLLRAIERGIDPAGKRLAVAMPTYRMAPADLADLVAYLKRLGTIQDPGLTDASIRVGTLVPARGPLAEMGKAISAVLAAYFDEVNAQGGIYNRKLELRVAESGESPRTAAEAARRLIHGEQVFAMVGAFMAGAEKELAPLIEGEEIPLVGPFALFPQADSPARSSIFYVFSGLAEQARAMVDFAAQTLKLEDPRIAIVHRESGSFPDIARAVVAQCEKSGWSAIDTLGYTERRFDPRHVARSLSRGGARAVFFLGSGEEARALMKEAAATGFTPAVFLLGSLVGKEVFDAPPSFKTQVFLAYPTAPSDQTPAGAAEYRALMEKYGLAAQHPAVQVSAYSAAKILVQGLKLAGRDLSRERLVSTLEGLYAFETGLTPPITYGPNRRVGALGAYVVAVDPEKKAFMPVSEWITPK